MIVLACFYFMIGVCIGSFSNVLIYRLPEGESINFPASHCLSCQTPLKWYHNIPLFSWAFLGGKCAFCKAKISIQYPLVELTCGVIMLLCYHTEVSDFSNYTELFKALMIGIVFILMLAMSITDFRYTAAPSSLLYASVVFSLLYALSVEKTLVALAFGAGFVVLAFVMKKVLKKEALGEADIYIFACMGAILGAKLGFFAIFIGAVLTLPAYAIAGAILKNRVKNETKNLENLTELEKAKIERYSANSINEFQMPFIPFLAMGLFLVYLFQDESIEFLKFIMGI
ncbi:MAG: prepilin peptidase [Campylobacteraceae bacterium]|nr:prepilin peptidase [Campylobacteraceae bacterium]